MKDISSAKKKRISVKESVGRGFRRTGYKLKKRFTYYKPSVFKRLKTGKKVAILLRPVWIALIVLIFFQGVRWSVILDGMFVDDKPIDGILTDTDLTAPDDVIDKTDEDDDGLSVDIIDDELTSSGNAVPIVKVDQKDKNVLNIVLMGSDTRVVGERGRTDSMMIASYNKNTNSLSLLSLLRDSLVPIDGHGWTKLCHANYYGGPGLLINTVNDCFNLDVQAYVIIDFYSFEDVIDKIGGLDMYLTSAEARYYQWNDGKAGTIHLTGEMALEHARNRHLDSDFGRTQRQRDILEAVYAKVSKLSVTKQVSIVEYLATKVTTNLDKSTFIGLATSVLSSGIPEIKTGHMPFDKLYTSATYKGMSVIKVDFAKNQPLIDDFIFGSGSEE